MNFDQLLYNFAQELDTVVEQYPNHPATPEIKEIAGRMRDEGDRLTSMTEYFQATVESPNHIQGCSGYGPDPESGV